eukprot:CAMPEP_0116986518 /NCGR_PEP_ID=MMETSP0467-20121206/62929_1 /TAXON_ID=283647 /ORGANISM="Mesodinium pulex, Strain SPMC105" /LENGTH=214 /DNA_ID=CAMNT_0004682103 /DNA_START=4211 /DNA_END=4855 /DNA_ORIENTATION=+
MVFADGDPNQGVDLAEPLRVDLHVPSALDPDGPLEDSGREFGRQHQAHFVVLQVGHVDFHLGLVGANQLRTHFHDGADLVPGILVDHGQPLVLHGVRTVLLLDVHEVEFILGYLLGADHALLEDLDDHEALLEFLPFEGGGLHHEVLVLDGGRNLGHVLLVAGVDGLVEGKELDENLEGTLAVGEVVDLLDDFDQNVEHVLALLDLHVLHGDEA